MFKNKILVRASSSSSSSTALLLLPLSLRHGSDDKQTVWIELEALCWKLSRQWRLACLPQPDQILLVYTKSQMDPVGRVVSEFIKLDPTINVGLEEEVKSGALNARAIEFGLKCLMLDHKWSCIRDTIFVESSFGSDQERTNLCALNVEVQCGACDEFVFVVSPDTIRFNRHKISDIVKSESMEIFEKNKEFIFENFDYSTACTTLPFLYEGYIKGLSKVLPEGESFDLIQDLWLIKHGLNLESNYFVSVQNSNGGCMNIKWLPSSYVIQGLGLSAAPKSIRESNAKLAYQSFIHILQAWDFFGNGPLIVTEQSVIGNIYVLPAWEKATTNQMQETNDSIFNDFLSSLDFRASKPDFGFTNNMNKENISIIDNNNNNNTPAAREIILPVKEKEQVKLLVPSFSKNKRTNAPKRSKEINNNISVQAPQQSKSSVNKQEKINEPILINNSSNCPASTAQVVVDQASKSILMPSFSKSKKTNTHKEKIQPKAPVKKNQNPKITVTDQNPKTKSEESSVQIGPPKSKPKPKTIKEKTNPNVNKEKSGILLLDNPEKNPINKSEESCLQDGPPNPKSKPKSKPKTKEEKSNPSENKEMKNDILLSLDNNPDKEQSNISINSLETTTTEKLQDGDDQVPVKKNCKKNKSEDCLAPKAKRVRQAVDKDEVITKVMDCHKRGQLQSLTVHDLRCFLSSKKAKVSGQKEELIRRASTFLD